MPRNQPIKQGGTGGKSPGNGHAVGSGSRPTGGTHKIPSSNPSSPQKIRGK